MPNLLDHLRAEQERLREEVDLLKTQMEAVLSWLHERDFSQKHSHEPMPAPPHPVSESATTIYRRLPPRFTVEDLIEVSEHTGINVFTAYEDLKDLIVAGWIAQRGEGFEKVWSSTRGNPSRSGFGGEASRHP